MLLYHGTTLENIRNILNKEKYKESVWNCSESDSFIYFWEKNKVLEELDSDSSKEEIIEKCVDLAFDSASIQAVSDIKADKLYALEINVPKKYEHLVEEDYSVPNNHGAVCIYMDDFDLNWIKKIYEVKHNHYSNIITVASLFNNDYFNHQKIDENLYDMAQAFADSDFSSIYEASFEITLNLRSNSKKEYSIQEFIKLHPELENTFYVKEINKKIEEKIFITKEISSEEKTNNKKNKKTKSF